MGRAATNPNRRHIRLIRLDRVTITTWRLRLTRPRRKTSMASIDVPTRLPRATGLVILAGITNMIGMNRLTRMAIITRLPILGKLVKMVKMVKLEGAMAKW